MLKRLLISFLLLLTVARHALADDQAGPAPPIGASLNEQVIRIPGDQPPAVTMQVTLMHPDGNGPFPLVVMNHGADNASFGNRGKRYRLSNSTFYFLSRGYAVAMPMMRGFSTTGGEIYHFGCDIAATGLANAKDITAVIRYLGNDPHFDTRRVIVAGQSMGGWNTLAAGALALPNVVALVNFNGGLRESDCKLNDPELADGAARFGARTKVPSIWFYGDNDKLFAPSVWRAMLERYNRAGGRAELIDIGTVMTNSHNFLSYPEELPVWTAAIDQFLARIGMPHAEIHPNDLPTPFPPPTRFADIRNVDAVPFLTPQTRNTYRAFLTQPFPRVFTIARGGGVSSATGGFDPLGRALLACRKAGAVCRVYAVDDHVVWTKPQGLGEQVFTLTLPQGQTKTVEFSLRLNPDCTPKAFAQFRVIQAPIHGRLAIGQRTGTPHFPAISPYAVCNGAKPLGTAVDYTPAAGYAGSDSFAYQDEQSGAPVYRFNVQVRP